MAIPDLKQIPSDDDIEASKVWNQILEKSFTDKSQRKDSQLSDRVDVTLKHYSVEDAIRILDGKAPAFNPPVSNLRRFSIHSLPPASTPAVVAPAQSAKKGPAGPSGNK